MTSPVAKAEMLIRRPGATFVSISHRGFQGTPEEIADVAIGSTEGFTFVVSGLKAWLEHGIELKLVYDHFPDKRIQA